MVFHCALQSKAQWLQAKSVVSGVTGVCLAKHKQQWWHDHFDIRSLYGLICFLPVLQIELLCFLPKCLSPNCIPDSYLMPGSCWSVVQVTISLLYEESWRWFDIDLDSLHKHGVHTKHATCWYTWVSRPNMYTYTTSRDTEHNTTRRHLWGTKVAKVSQICCNLRFHWAAHQIMGLHQRQTTTRRSGINAWYMPVAYQHTHICTRKTAHLW